MREESAPPENELQKLGEKTPTISEHELRFRKSTEKLHVPDWYRERRTVRTTDLDTSYTSTASERLVPNGAPSYGGGTPTYSAGSPPSQLPPYGTTLQPYAGVTTPSGISLSYGPSSYLPYSSSSKTTTQYEVSQTRYSTPFSYEQGRYSAPPPPAAPVRSTPTPVSTTGAPLVIPYGMFDKYRDEIEEMRRSRTSLHQIGTGTGDERKVCIV